MNKEKLNTLKSSFQFKQPKLTGIFFLPNRQYKGKDKTIFLKFNTKLLNKVIDKNKESYSGTVELEVTNFENDNEEEINKNPYLLNVTMQAKFKWPVKWDGSKVKEFIKINAASLLFSYIRPVISGITGMSEFERVDLPFIDFSKAVDKD